ncbi:hypothetical protein LARV_03251 [Longilinea arvoryzae]|uniref:Uncharacterized protein n=1 Tax=Longilinea arvoryzae TaxID=360412 RepID=A0A0S7BCJ8_9CHLR|nr:ESX secretion-associated protein EspG [Longilinea arvoryzae]GAP15463.1 hypothetical protein LARV_03251 [Longilinea arvoryzae]
MTTTKPEPILTVSQEELYFLLVLLKARRIPGLEGIFEPDATEQERTHLLDAARRALVARGLVTLQVDGRATMDEFALAVVGTCVRPLYSVIMENTGLDRSNGVFWHGIKSLIVEHSIPQEGIHRFRALPADSDLVRRFMGASEVHLSEDAGPMEEGLVMQSAFDKARQVCRDAGDEAAGGEVLMQGGLSSQAAEKLAAILAGAENSTTVAFMRHAYPDGEEELFGGSALAGPQGAVLTVPTDTGSGEVRVRPLTRQGWQDWLGLMLEVIREK